MSTQQRAAGNACPTAAFSFDPARLAQRRRWAGAFAALCGLALSPSALLAEEHSQHQDHAVELAPSVVTGVAQSSPLTIVTNPKEPRQPVPASDGADYLKTIPGFAVIRNGGSNGDPVLRGMFGSRLNILTNGGMMLGACPNRMDAPTSYISPETYDKLTVIKGPQTVLWGPGASAGTILFEREPERFGELGSRVNASLLAGSNGRFDKVLDAAAGNRLGYLRFTGNHAQSDDYEDGAGNTVPSRWKKWNGDVAVGWTPDEDTLIELTAGKGDGEARYAGRGMDGSQFKRESLGLRFVKSNVSDVLEKVEAQVYYNYADHIMDNFRLRTPDPSSMMPMPMASQVDRRTLGGRLAATWRWDDFKLVTGVDAMRNEHRARGSKYDMMTDYYTDADQFPWNKDAVFHNYGAFGELTWFAAERDRLIGGLRLDRASVKDYRQTLKSGHMGHAMANPTANDTRADTLPSGFVRYEHDLADSPTTLYAGLGHAERFPDYWELFSPKRGPNGSVNAFDKIKPEKTTQLDFGLQYNGDKLQAWASGYVGVGPGLHPVQLSRGHDGFLDPGDQRRRADHGRRAGRFLPAHRQLEDRRQPGLCLGQEQLRRPRAAADPAAGSALRPDLRGRRLECRQPVAGGRAAESHRQGPGQRGRQGLRQERRLRRLLAQRRLPGDSQRQAERRCR